MSILRQALRRIADTFAGDRLRTTLNYKPPINLRPKNSNASVSDLFPWRVDETWETRFEITNMPSFLFPDKGLKDRVTVVAFRADGSEIDRARLDLAPLETRSFFLADLVGSNNGAFGTFAVFHDANWAAARLAETRTHMAERGYVSFRRKGDAVWGVVHGNLHCLSMAPGQSSLGFVHGRRPRAEPYRLQLDMSDCQAFELTFTNPSSVPQPLEVLFLSDSRTELNRESRIVQPRGIEVVHWDNTTQPCSLCEAWGAMPMWRPAIFKHYDSHFNVLHA